MHGSTPVKEPISGGMRVNKLLSAAALNLRWRPKQSEPVICRLWEDSMTDIRWEARPRTMGVLPGASSQGTWGGGAGKECGSQPGLPEASGHVEECQLSGGISAQAQAATGRVGGHFLCHAHAGPGTVCLETRAERIENNAVLIYIAALFQYHLHFVSNTLFPKIAINYFK